MTNPFAIGGGAEPALIPTDPIRFLPVRSAPAAGVSDHP